MLSSVSRAPSICTSNCPVCFPPSLRPPALRSCPLHAPYIPLSHHKSVSGRDKSDNGVNRKLSFPQGLAHRRHTVIVGQQPSHCLLSCLWFLEHTEFLQEQGVNLLPNPLPGGPPTFDLKEQLTSIFTQIMPMFTMCSNLLN